MRGSEEVQNLETFVQVVASHSVAFDARRKIKACRLPEAEWPVARRAAAPAAGRS